MDIYILLSRSMNTSALSVVPSCYWHQYSHQSDQFKWNSVRWVHSSFYFTWNHFPPSLHVNDALLCFLSSFVLFLLPFHFGWNHLTISGCFYSGFMQKAVSPVVVCITDCFFYHMSNDCINYHLCNCSSHWAELNVMSVMPHGFNSCENPLFAYFYASEQILRPLWGLGETND